MGRLTGKYSKANPPPSGRGFSNVNMTELEPLLEAMRRIAAERNVSVSSVALNYVVCKGMFDFTSCFLALRRCRSFFGYDSAVTRERFLDSFISFPLVLSKWDLGAFSRSSPRFRFFTARGTSGHCSVKSKSNDEKESMSIVRKIVMPFS